MGQKNSWLHRLQRWSMSLTMHQVPWANRESLLETTETKLGLTHCFTAFFPSGCALEQIMWEIRKNMPCSSSMCLLCVAIVLRMLFYRYAGFILWQLSIIVIVGTYILASFKLCLYTVSFRKCSTETGTKFFYFNYLKTRNNCLAFFPEAINVIRSNFRKLSASLVQL